MTRKRILWHLYSSYLFITFLSLIAVTWYTTDSIRHIYLQNLQTELESRGRLIENELYDHGVAFDVQSIDDACKRYGEILSARITVILPTGQVIGESEQSSEHMENHRSRPEVQKALAGEVGTEIRYSDTLKLNMMYTALPIFQEGRVEAVIRVSIPATAVDHALQSIFAKIMLGGLIVALVAAGISLVISRRISHPLEMLKQGAERFARGDLKSRLEVPGSDEIGRLAEAMNLMAAQLDDRIRMIMQQRNEQEAILSSMVEGVLAVDMQQRIISLNQTAAEWLNVRTENVQGLSIHTILTNPELHDFIQQLQHQHETKEQEIILDQPNKQVLQAHGSWMCDSEGKQIGSVVVLHDVTRVRNLEIIRQDFVANVSHELKTPITSIKGFVETLMDGALNNRDDAMRFLKIIAKQADRLHSIIEDLLNLSRIEQEEGRHRIHLEPCRLLLVVQSAVDFCRPKAQEKEIEIEISGTDDLEIPVNPPLLEQAVINLVDNAIKYSGSRQKVKVNLAQQNPHVTIGIQDWGCGIGSDHLNRIFERFYRVDKARSRKLGGTGLGLAIVKHISQIHGGFVTVESTLGQGSLFTIHLPTQDNGTSPP